MRTLTLTLLLALLPALAVAAQGYNVDIDSNMSRLIITFLNGNHVGAMDGTLHLQVDPGLEDGAVAEISTSTPR